MTFEKAISILGLNPNFTEEEFKSAYRRLSHECHPDKHEGTELYEEIQRKQQEINAAKDFLKNYYQIKPTTTAFEISLYIKQKKDELIKIINYTGQTIIDEDYITTLNAIKKAIAEFETEVFNFYVLIKEDVDNAYNECIETIKGEFDNFKNFFYKKYYISEEEVKEQLNYNCTLKEFYEQLQKIESKYGKTSKTKNQLLSEIQKYQYFAGYEKLETLINVSLNNALIRMKQNNFQDVQQYIDKMHQEILEIFQTYHTQAQMIRELSQVVYATKNESIQDAYEGLTKDFKDGRAFQDIELAIEKLQSLIQKHQQHTEKVNKFKQNKQAINKIYKSLMDRYNKVVKKYNIITEYDKIAKLNEFLNKILKVFNKGCEELQDLEYFNIFNNLTFEDIDNDKEIMKEAIQTLKQNKSNVYLKTTNTYILDDTSFFYFDEKNMIMYKDTIGDISCQEITQEELETEYIPIEKILESAVYIGDYRKIMGTITVKCLYETDKIVIYFLGNKFIVKPKSKSYNIQPIKPADDSFEPFKNKQHVCEMIEKQIKGKVEEYKKQQSQKANSYSPNSNIYGEAQFNTEDGYYQDESGNKRRR